MRSRFDQNVWLAVLANVLFFVQCIQTELQLSFGTKTVMTHAY